MFKPLQIIIYDLDYDSDYFQKEQAFLFLGEISNMPGHCAVVNKSGKVFWGIHTENFKEAIEDEI